MNNNILHGDSGIPTGRNSIYIGTVEGPPGGNDNVLIGTGEYVPPSGSLRDGNVVLLAGGKALLHVDRNGVVRVDGRVVSDGVQIREALDKWVRGLIGMGPA